MRDQSVEPAAGESAGSPPRLLVIEDDPATQELLRAALDDHFGAGTVLRVFDRVGAVDEGSVLGADLILCDFQLPDGSGLDALARIRGFDPTAHVIMVTGQSEPETAVAAVRAGAADYIVKTREFLRTLPLAVEKNLEVARMQVENARLHDALNRSLDALKAKNRDLEAAVRKLEEIALTDELTGLSNRRHLTTRLRQMFHQATRYGEDLACLMIDLDGFKAINDTLGHQRGDELLALTGRIIAGQTRSSDLAARIGGDEFVILLPHTSCETAAALAERLAEAFDGQARHLWRPGTPCGMSIGVACVGVSAPQNADELIAQADRALYAAKAAGRRRISVCGPDGRSMRVVTPCPTAGGGEDSPSPAA